MPQKKQMTQKETERLFWRQINNLCVRCVNECKQSTKAIILYCPTCVLDVSQRKRRDNS